MVEGHRTMKQILLRLWASVDRLGIRLAMVLAVALLPLMIVSIVRSQSVVNEAVARSRAALTGVTLNAVQDEINTIEGAKAVAQTLSNWMPTLFADPDRCNRLMRDTLKGTAYSFAGFYDTKGLVTCSSAPGPFSVGMTPDLEKQIADPKPIVLVNEDAPASETSVIYAAHPVFDTGGSLLGFTAISIPHKRLQQTGATPTNAVFLTLNALGAVLSAPGTLDEAQPFMPQLKPDEYISDQSKSFRAVGGDGIERLYAIVPVVDGELYALSTWPFDHGLSGDFYLRNPALFPALMWLASLAVAWFATSLFVTRHVVKLRRTMRDFAKTRRITTVKEFQTAPGELRDVADTYIGMTDMVLRDEAKIEDALRQKDVLLREVHHRVKNNLQLIASIMSMQMRQTRSKEVKQIMQSLHDRVNSLATIHRNLYQTSGQADISMEEHLDVIVRQVVKMAAARDASIELKTDFDEIRLIPDQAVPLSLFVTEAMTNALKYIGAEKGKATSLCVSLEVLEGDTAEVIVTNSIPPLAAQPDAEKSSGLGSELMEAFAMQLSGDFSAGVEADQFVVRLSFPIDPLHPED
jgi:two-component sensor histidine kinase